MLGLPGFDWFHLDHGEKLCEMLDWDLGWSDRCSPRSQPITPRPRF